MKKVLVIAIMLGAGLAYASSIGVPWFVDNAPTGVHPPTSSKAESYIYIHNNHSEQLEVTVAYYTAVGAYIGPDYDNTFVIEPNASLAYRPVVNDTVFESLAAQAIPNRPRFTYPPSNTDNDLKKNGSVVFTWLGDASYMSGAYWLCQIGRTQVNSTDTTEAYTYMGYGHLLPAGA